MTSRYASPSGTGDGLAPSTPASLAAARAAAVAGDTIVLRGGMYALAAGLSLTAADSWINWRAYGGEEPVLSGGTQVTGWTLHDAGAGIYRASLAPGTVSRHLWVNGQRATRARGSVSCTTSNGGQTYVSTDTSLPTFARPADLEFVFTGSVNNWTQCRLGVASASRVGSTTTFTMGEAWSRWSGGRSWPGSPSYVENAYEFLSASTPGQWYLDAGSATIYYVPRPGEDMATADAWISRVETLIGGTNASPVTNVEFNGISFRHAGWMAPTTQQSFMELQANQYIDPANGYLWSSTATGTPAAAVRLPRASRVTFYGCTFEHLGAIGLRLHDGAKDCLVTDCVVRDVSSSGICVADFGSANQPSPEAQNTRITISRNDISTVGAEYAGAVGVLVGTADHVSVVHNEIHDCPYTGISLGWVWAPTGYAYKNEIAYNHIHHVLASLHDGGGIYVLGKQGYSNDRSTVHDNYIHDVGSLPNQAPDCAIYFDTGCYLNAYANVLVGSESGTPTSWYFSNAVDNVASGNYATAGWVTPSKTGISAPTEITGTDPAGWPSGAQAIAAAAGPVGPAPDLTPDPGPAFVAAGTFITASGAPGLPVGLATGDTMLLAAWGTRFGSLPAAPAGWAEVHRAAPLALFSRRVVGDPASEVAPTVTLGSPGAAVITAYRGCDAVPVNVRSVAITTASGETATSPAVTTTADSTLLLAFMWACTEWGSGDAIVDLWGHDPAMSDLTGLIAASDETTDQEYYIGASIGSRSVPAAGTTGAQPLNAVSAWGNPARLYTSGLLVALQLAGSATTTTTTTTAAPPTTTTTTAPTTTSTTTTTTAPGEGVAAVFVGGVGFVPDEAGALRLVTSLGVQGLRLVEPDDSTPIRVVTSLGVKGIA